MSYRTRIIRMLQGNGYQPAPVTANSLAVFVAPDGDSITVPAGGESYADLQALANIEMKLLQRQNKGDHK